MAVDFERLGAELLAHAEELVPAWFPQGRREGHEWAVGNLAGDPGDSLKINLHNGKWMDFAAGDKGGDLISLYAAMHSLSQLEAAKQLGGRANGADVPRGTPDPAGRPPDDPSVADVLERPPAGQSFTGIHPRHGKPSAIYTYRDREGLLYHVCRYDPEDGKVIIPWRWMKGQWRMKHVPKPRPIYQLDQVQLRPEAQVLIVEGEKACDAALTRFKTTVVCTWSGGTAHVTYADWRPLEGRSVQIWPDADAPGQVAALSLAKVLSGLGCKVKITDVTGQPDGWDLADAVAEGWDLKKIVGWARDRNVDYAPEHGRMGTVPEPTEGPAAESSPAAELQEATRAPAPESVGQRWSEYALVMKPRGGEPYANLDNAVRILAKHDFGSRIWYDEFHQQVRYVDRHGEVHEWGAIEDSRLALFFQRTFGLATIGTNIAAEALGVHAHARKKNEARDWLRALEWDGEDRLEELAPKGFGTETDIYHRAVGRCFIMGMAARILRPGCKLDNVPVFEGRQGTFKTTALEILGGPYYGTQHERVGDKDFYLVMRGKLLIEISELSSFKGAELERVRGVLTTRTDTFRAPYERRASDHPRMSAFAGTTNADDWNADDEARRFWPVACGVINTDWLKEHRTQLFAEARVRVDRGELWYDVPVDMAREEQAKRQQGDAFDESLADWLALKQVVTIPQCLNALGIVDRARWDRPLQNRITGVLKRAGFNRAVVWQKGQTQRVWRRRLEQGAPLPQPPDTLELSPPQDF